MSQLNFISLLPCRQSLIDDLFTANLLQDIVVKRQVFQESLGAWRRLGTVGAPQLFAVVLGQKLALKVEGEVGFQAPPVGLSEIANGTLVEETVVARDIREEHREFSPGHDAPYHAVQVDQVADEAVFVVELPAALDALPRVERVHSQDVVGEMVLAEVRLEVILDLEFLGAQCAGVSKLVRANNGGYVLAEIWHNLVEESVVADKVPVYPIESERFIAQGAQSVAAPLIQPISIVSVVNRRKMAL